MSDQGRVLFVDDEDAMRMAAGQWLRLADFAVEEFSRAADCLKHITPDFNGVVISDVRMPQMNGMELLAQIIAIDPDIPVVLVTGHGDVAMAVDAMRQGAYDFVEKPFQPETLVTTIKRAMEKRRLVQENRKLQHTLQQDSDIESRLIGNCEAIQHLRRDILDLAGTDASVLLQGETGCGKEVIARCLHDFSPRAKKNFVAINCGAVPEQIFESELFGHEAGAFTGAQKKRIGKIEHANAGTLFFDEVISMPLHLQVKLLRAIQEREIVRLGANDPLQIDARFISACNVDLRAACGEGKFREDLYYRLNVAELRVPPLRERGSDIALLFEFFVHRASEKYHRDAPDLNESAIGLLLSYEWPGNVRELKNAAERFVLSSAPNASQRLELILRRPPSVSPRPTTAKGLNEILHDFEGQILSQALKTHRGNIAAVMETLDLPRRTLNQKMLNHGLDRKDFA